MVFTPRVLGGCRNEPIAIICPGPFHLSVSTREKGGVDAKWPIHDPLTLLRIKYTVRVPCSSPPFFVLLTSQAFPLIRLFSQSGNQKNTATHPRTGIAGEKVPDARIVCADERLELMILLV